MWSPRLTQAFDLAAKLHNRQLRKGSDVPYLSHLLAVGSLVLENGGDEDTLIAALLHDAAEDQGGSRVLVTIREIFGERVAAIVEQCSDTLQDPKPPWKERKANHLNMLQGADEDALLVMAADKLHNLRSILADYLEVGESLWPRFRGGRDEILWYYGEMVHLLSADVPRLAEELARLLEHLRAEIRKNNGSGPTAR